MVKIILLRHAQTDDNSSMKLSGHIDSKVSIYGLDQIKRTTDILKKEKIDLIYSSSSSRTRYTVNHIAKEKNLDVIVDRNLNEINFGDLEGKTFDQIKEKYKSEFDKMISLGFEYTYPNGESFKQFHERVANCIDQIIKKSDGKTVLICTHSGVIRSIISHLISKTYNYHWNFKIDNCSISMLEIQDDFAVIHTLNNTSHLKAGIKYEGRED